jgi:uncharacterized YigZ family protein
VPSYRYPLAAGSAELREKGSRFWAVLEPARTEDEARAVLEALRRREPGATHHCWAWRLGPGAAERSSDDGEPAGTAGVPILQVLRGADLSDVMVVVVRWFGGTKLGKGGLARAYAGATKSALGAIEIGERQPTVEVVVVLPYEHLGALKRLVHPPEVVIAEETYDETVSVRLIVQEDSVAPLKERLASIGATWSGG